MKEIKYKFIGSESDRKMFVDPEPNHGIWYSEKQIDDVIESNPHLYIANYFETFEEDFEDLQINHITPQIRIMIVKTFPELFKTLEDIESYINTGKK